MGRLVKKNVSSDKAICPTEAAYIAGLIDGEGTVTLWPHKVARRRPYSFVSMLKIANTSYELLQGLIDTLGNGRIDVNPRKDGSRPCYNLSLTTKQIRHVLPQVRPFLRLKARQADLLQEYFDLQDKGRVINGIGVSDADYPRVVEIWQEVASLNQRGDRPIADLQLEFRELPARGDWVCSVDGCEGRGYRGSSWCYDHWRQYAKHEVRKCKHCQEDMVAYVSSKKYCSKRCQHRAYYLETRNSERLEATLCHRHV